MNDLIRLYLEEKINHYQQVAFEAYSNKEYEQAVAFFKQAEELATNIDDKKLLVYFKFWKGVCLRFMQKYKLA